MESGASGPEKATACFNAGLKEVERREDGGKEGRTEPVGGTEKGPLSVLNESRRTFFLPPPVVLSNSISTEEQ